MIDITLSMITFFGKIKIVFPQPFDVYAKQQFLLTFFNGKTIKVCKGTTTTSAAPFTKFSTTNEKFQRHINSLSYLFCREKFLKIDMNFLKL